jgi:predicted AAA+ superfamily ATPase
VREELQSTDRLIVIDEIQKLPVLMDEVHACIEEGNARFLLTGSSARKLQRTHTGLMAGRARIRHLWPFSCVEAPAFDLHRALEIGLLPPVWLGGDPRGELASYASAYLTEEIRAEALARNLPAFSRFLHTAALTNAGIVSFESVARDAQVPARTVREYFQVLHDTLIATVLEPLAAGRKAISHGKCYFFDIGVVHQLIGRNAIPEGTDEYGKAFEWFVFHELRAWRDSTGSDLPIRFWRTHDGAEVDFVLGDDIAIEVKASTMAQPKHAQGLRRLHEARPMRRRLLVTRDPARRQMGDIEVWPWLAFVTALWAGEIAPPHRATASSG